MHNTSTSRSEDSGKSSETREPSSIMILDVSRRSSQHSFIKTYGLLVEWEKKRPTLPFGGIFLDHITLTPGEPTPAIAYPPQINRLPKCILTILSLISLGTAKIHHLIEAELAAKVNPIFAWRERSSVRDLGKLQESIRLLQTYKKKGQVWVVDIEGNAPIGGVAAITFQFAIENPFTGARYSAYLRYGTLKAAEIEKTVCKEWADGLGFDVMR
ncbi:hypothetical protein SLS60_005462 [Paraconiothyrium brasiliense]|uniref:Uncharacterized protein n=1 Tax=Paraconiothyrium brasiliense TaxID=300254 RepID=A0ABR3RHG3_9PLEO